MTRDDILRMAREADLTLQDDYEGEVSRWREDKDLTPYLERFAALVAAAEREHCAKVAEWTPSLMDTPHKIAAAIRARGKT